MIQKIIADYLAFLLEQIKVDYGWLSTWWMWVPALIPLCFYLCFLCVKWFFLLAPVTVPVTTWGIWRVNAPSPVHHHYHGGDTIAAYKKSRMN